jgi:hypothetical protein
MESKSNYHIITPFYRNENRAFLMENVKGFIWHPIEGHIDRVTDQTYAKINKFIKYHEIVDEDYYQILMDDDALPQDFLEISKRIEGDIVIFSMKRGDRIPEGLPAYRRHPTWPLIAARENMKIGSIGLQQIRFKGKVLKTLYCQDHPYADGMVAQELASRQDIVFVPDVFILFNYLEPGRYDKTINY